MMSLRVGFVVRLAAVLIDVAFSFVVVLFLLITGMVSLWSHSWQIFNPEAMSEVNRSMQIPLFLANLVIMVIYALEAVSGFTPGKLLLRIRPGTAGGEKGTPDFYIIRFMIKGMPHVLLLMAWILGLSGEAGTAVELLGWFSSLLTAVIWLGGLLALDERKQALHDRIARSAVYRIRDLE